MKTACNAKRSCANFVGTATLLVLATGLTCTVQARDNVSISVGIGLPGMQAGVGNSFPGYAQPHPIYVQPAQIYVAPAPVYYGSQPFYVAQQPIYYGTQPVYAQPQPVYYGRSHGRRHHGGNYIQAPRPDYGGGYTPNYAPIYYRR